MDEIELYKRLGTAICIGLLIGFERGWQTRGKVEGERIAGVRTFTLIGLLGGIWGLLTLEFGDIVLGIAFVGLSVLVVAAYLYNLHSDKKPDYGITTEVAALLTFSLAALATRGNVPIAAASAVIAVAVLGSKSRFHGWIRTITKLELDAVVKLLLTSVVLLPVLPNRGFGPEEILNPYQIWWMVVLIAAISFAGYIAMKLFGARAAALMIGVFGGLASSTAVTLAFARMASKERSLAGMLAGGAVISAAVTFLRILVVVAIFNTSMVAELALTLGLMAATGFVAALVLGFEHKKTIPSESFEMHNPADIRMAILFGVFIAGILLLSHWLQGWFGVEGVYALAGISGIGDVDALTLSMTEIGGDKIKTTTAANAIVIAALVNLTMKGIFVFVIEKGAMARRVCMVFAIIAVTGIASYLLK